MLFPSRAWKYSERQRQRGTNTLSDSVQRCPESIVLRLFSSCILLHTLLSFLFYPQSHASAHRTSAPPTPPDGYICIWSTQKLGRDEFGDDEDVDKLLLCTIYTHHCKANSGALLCPLPASRVCGRIRFETANHCRPSLWENDLPIIIPSRGSSIGNILMAVLKRKTTAETCSFSITRFSRSLRLSSDHLFPLSHTRSVVCAFLARRAVARVRRRQRRGQDSLSRRVARLGERV
jgi:hypothetical protein